MDSPRRSSFLPAFNLFVLAILLIRFPVGVHGSGVLRVKRKFGANTPIDDLVRHDELRHARRLSARPVDVHLGGSLYIGMWYADIAIGTPPRHLQVHVDTGSPVTWVDCENCIGCVKSNATVKLETYNPKLSSTARIVTGGERLCDDMYLGLPKNSSSEICEFQVWYMDRSAVEGYYVTDLVSFDQVSSNPNKGLANITFGCTTVKVGDNMDDASVRGAEGLIGLSWNKHSILFQLASLGKVRKEFAHCLDEYGGIFAIGHVVKPKVTSMAPFLQDGHGLDYTVSVTAIEVGVHSHIHQYRAAVDTGSTLMLLPKAAFDFAMEKIFLKHPILRKEVEKDNKFHFLGSLEDFPTITFQVNQSHALKLYSHDYMLPVNPEKWLFALRTFGDDKFILGDIVLRNKLFIYDLENMQLGWQDYDCSSSIELEDEAGVCNISAHNITSNPN